MEKDTFNKAYKLNDTIDRLIISIRKTEDKQREIKASKEEIILLLELGTKYCTSVKKDLALKIFKMIITEHTTELNKAQAELDAL